MPGKAHQKKPVPSSSAAEATANSSSGSRGSAAVKGVATAVGGNISDLKAGLASTVTPKLVKPIFALNSKLVSEILSKVSPTMQDLRVSMGHANIALVKSPKLVNQYDEIIETLLNVVLSKPEAKTEGYHCYPAFQWGSIRAVERFTNPDINIIQLSYALIILGIKRGATIEPHGFRQVERAAAHKKLARILSQRLESEKIDLISYGRFLVNTSDKELYAICKPYLIALTLDDIRTILKESFQKSIEEDAIVELIELTKQERFDKKQQAALWQECLRWAITASQPVIVKKLLQEKMANVNLGCYRFLEHSTGSVLINDVTPLTLAIFNHQAKNAGQVVDVLLSFGVDTFGICDIREIDVASTDLKTLTALRDANKVPEDIYNYRGVVMAPGKNRILNLTSASGCVELMQKILTCTPTSLNTSEINGMTPLMAATACNQVEMVNYLIQQRADLSSKNSDGMTALQIAEQLTENTVIIKLLRDAEKNYVVKNSDAKAAAGAVDNKHHVSSTTAVSADSQSVFLDNTEIKEKIFAAIRRGDLPTFKNLFIRAYVDWRDLFDNTALHIACAFRQNEIVEELLEFYRVDVNAKNIRGRTPLHLVCATGNEQLIELLVNNGADSLATDKEGNTPLMLLIDYRKKQLGKNNFVMVDVTSARKNLELNMVKRFLAANPEKLHTYVTQQGKILGFATKAELESAMKQDHAPVITVTPFIA